MSAARLVVVQVRYQLKVFMRSPVAVFFTVMFPVLMLVLMNALFAGDADIEGPGGEAWPVQQFYVGGLSAFAAVSATFTNLANVVPVRRDDGILKRWRSTPLPAWACIAGYVGSATIVAAVGVALTWGLGVAFYDITIDVAKLPVAVLTFVLAVGSFAALGLAVASLIRTAESAPAVANAIILPLGFVSSVFVPTADPPAWMAFLGDAFPLKPFAETFQDVFNPFVDPPAFVAHRLIRIAAWGVVGVAIALWRFRWEPHRTSGAPGRRRGRGRGRQAPATTSG
ncbi:MAG: ABC transporter permease [Acidimicrobiales bacterium]|nr:ABC transporter permease [Acidimicrobiales bacterium]